jgi:eukaryotic-like serine/threonine-protein kinase
MRDAELQRLIGRTIAGKFFVEQLLGTGAMGAVFRARQVTLDKTVAIKVLHGEHAQDATFAARFQREAKAASRLNHPNSMQVVDFGVEPDGLLYIAMEYVDGRTLHRLLREEWPLPAHRIADILMQALAAIAVAHDMGVVHRDLKPENVMVLRGTDDDGRAKDVVKVCDFGIAKITDSRAYRGGERQSIAPVTTAGFLVGTPEYMSPEQGRGERLGPESDLYSAGVILYEMLTRRVPFTAENAIGVVLKHIAEAPQRPSLVAIGVDRRLEAICLRALNKAPEQRFRSAREMRAELRFIAEERTAPAAAPSATLAQPPAEGAMATSPTISMQPPVRASYSHGVDPSAPKSTLLGVTSTAPGVSSRRALLVAGAALTSGAVIAAAAMMMTRSHARLAGTPLPVNTTEPAPATSVAALEIEPLGALSPADPTPAVGSARAPPHSKGVVSLTPNARALGETSAGGVAPGGVVMPQPPGSGAPARSGSAQAPSAAPAPSSNASRLAALAAAPADPNFDPERGYVEVGLINAQGVRESAVRTSLRGIGLVRCYKSALRAKGAAATGTATLDLSFDENGVARSAIVTGADFLPGLARCLQEVSAGARIAPSQLGAGGGTAEVLLAFKGGG